MKQIPTNAPNGVAFTITTHINQTGATNLVSGGGWYPSTGVIVITDNETSDNDKHPQRPMPDSDEPRL